MASKKGFRLEAHFDAFWGLFWSRFREEITLPLECNLLPEPALRGSDKHKTILLYNMM